MKHFQKHILLHLTCFCALFFSFAMMPTMCKAEGYGSMSEEKLFIGNGHLCPDSIHISLLTCGPHQEIYALYGHTALRFEDRSRGIDIAVNYGAFSFQTHFFALKFMFGLTDYEMGLMRFDDFCYQYSYFGSSVVQQEFNLTPEEKLKVAYALEENAKPENVIYRYNYYYDNCTTRARDIVCNNIQGKVVFNEKVPEGLTYRKMIHENNEEHPWARLGNDLLLGVGSDRQITSHDMQFLPAKMYAAAELAYIIDSKGNKRPLILNETKILEQRAEMVHSEFPLSPLNIAIIVLALEIMICVTEYFHRSYLWWFDALLFLFVGACGIIITAMIFSQHPTVKLNIQILIFNPLIVFFGYQAIRHNIRRVKEGNKRKAHWLWKVLALMAIFAQVLYGVGVQWLDASVVILSVGLLSRYLTNIFPDYKSRKH